MQPHALEGCSCNTCCTPVARLELSYITGSPTHWKATTLCYTPRALIHVHVHVHAEAAFGRQVQLQEQLWQPNINPNPNPDPNPDPNPNPSPNQVQLQEQLWQHGAAAKAAAKWRAPHMMRRATSP